MRNICLSNYDFIGLYETWLSPNVDSSKLGLLNYVTYHCDHNTNTSSRARGGGVLLSVNNKYLSHVLPVPTSPVEHIFVITKINLNYIIIGNAYFPHRTDISIYNIHFDIINNSLISFPYVKNIIMVSDYNFPKLNWLTGLNSFFPDQINLSTTKSEFVSKLYFLNLFQFNNVNNSSGLILDLVLSNFNNVFVSKSVNPLVPCATYFPGLLISIPIIVIKPIEYNTCMYNFFKCNYEDINFSLAFLNWLNLFKDLNINQAVDMFYSIVYEIIDIFVPKQSNVTPNTVCDLVGI